MHYLLAFCLFTPILGLLCWKDCRERLLPNTLTFGMAALGFIWRFWADGAGGLWDGFLGGLAGGLFLFIPFLMRAAGGGDVKMLFAAGIITGLRFCAAQLLFVSIAGLLLAGFMLAAKTVSPVRLKHCLKCIFDPRYDRVAGKAALPPVSDERCRLPFGVAIAFGTLATLGYAWYLEGT